MDTPPAFDVCGQVARLHRLLDEEVHDAARDAAALQAARAREDALTAALDAERRCSALPCVPVVRLQSKCLFVHACHVTVACMRNKPNNMPTA